jgi:hypothetical protein
LEQNVDAVEEEQVDALKDKWQRKAGGEERQEPGEMKTVLTKTRRQFKNTNQWEANMCNSSF